MDKFVPVALDDSHGIMAVNLSACPTCSRRMVWRPSVAYHVHTFPQYIGDNFDAQAKHAGWAVASSQKNELGRPICEECAKEGKSSFLCALCNEIKPSTKEKLSFGDPPEFLCSDCFSTVTAEKWDKAEEELMERHRYDFE